MPLGKPAGPNKAYRVEGLHRLGGPLKPRVIHAQSPEHAARILRQQGHLATKVTEVPLTAGKAPAPPTAPRAASHLEVESPQGMRYRFPVGEADAQAAEDYLKKQGHKVVGGVNLPGRSPAGPQEPPPQPPQPPSPGQQSQPPAGNVAKPVTPFTLIRTVNEKGFPVTSVAHGEPDAAFERLGKRGLRYLSHKPLTVAQAAEVWRKMSDHLKRNEGEPKGGMKRFRVRVRTKSGPQTHLVTAPTAFSALGRMVDAGHKVTHVEPVRPRRLARPKRYSREDHLGLVMGVREGNKTGDTTPHLVHTDYLEENGFPVLAETIRRSVNQDHPLDQAGTGPVGWGHDYEIEFNHGPGHHVPGDNFLAAHGVPMSANISVGRDKAGTPMAVVHNIRGYPALAVENPGQDHWNPVQLGYTLRTHDLDLIRRLADESHRVLGYDEHSDGLDDQKSRDQFRQYLSGLLPERLSRKSFATRKYAAKPDAGHAFVSALRRLRSKQQQALHGVAKEIAGSLNLNPAVTRDALHDGPGGATPSIAQAVAGGDPETARYAAAWYGLLTRTPALGVFHVQPNGPDSAYKFTMRGSGEQVRKQLDRGGITPRVLLPRRDGWDVFVYDQGRRLRENVRAFAQAHGLKPEESFGKGETLGHADPAEARAKFRQVIMGYENKPRRMARPGRPWFYARLGQAEPLLGTDFIHQLHDDSGQRIGHIWLTPQENGDLKINHVGVLGHLKNTLGPAKILGLRKQLLAAYPGSRRITGLRVSGMNPGRQAGVNVRRNMARGPSRKSFATDRIKGGNADNIPPSKFPPKKVAEGARVEREHTSDPALAAEIARDHLAEMGLGYYPELRKMEGKLKRRKKMARPVRYSAGDHAAMASGVFHDPSRAPIYADWLADHDAPIPELAVRRALENNPDPRTVGFHNGGTLLRFGDAYSGGGYSIPVNEEHGRLHLYSGSKNALVPNMLWLIWHPGSPDPKSSMTFAGRFTPQELIRLSAAHPELAEVALPVMHSVRKHLGNIRIPWRLINRGRKKMSREANPYVVLYAKGGRKSKAWISAKIRKMIAEGKPRDVAVAASLHMAGVPKKG